MSLSRAVAPGTPTALAGEPPRFSTGRNWLTLVVCCTALFMTTLDNTILNVALPALQRGLHASTSGLQWTVDSYILVRASTLFLCASLGDRFGRRRIFGCGLFTFVVFSAACGLAPNLDLLVCFRSLQGAGSALMTPASLGIITSAFTHPRQKAQAIGIWGATTGLSTTAGPLLGGVLVQYVGWRSVFWVNVPVGILALVGTRFLMESKSPKPRAFDIPGQMVICVALVSLTYALIDGPDRGWGSPLIITLLVVSVLAWFLFVYVERHVPSPLLEMSYFRQPALVGAIVVAIVAFIASNGVLFFNTLYLQEVRHLTPFHAGALTIPISALGLIFSPISGRMTGSRGPRLPASIGIALIAFATFMLAFVISPVISISVLLLGYAILGIGVGFVNTPLTTAAVSSLPPERASVAGAVTSTSRQIGTTLGVALVGSIVFSIASSSDIQQAHGVLSHAAGLSYIHALRYGYGVVAVLAVMATGLALHLFRRVKEPPASPLSESERIIGGTVATTKTRS